MIYYNDGVEWKIGDFFVTSALEIRENDVHRWRIDSFEAYSPSKVRVRLTAFKKDNGIAQLSEVYTIGSANYWKHIGEVKKKRESGMAKFVLRVSESS